MTPEELDNQFKEMESDPQVQAAATGTPPAAAKKKRITVAELNKAMGELTELVDTEIFRWLDQLDNRVRHFENAEAEKPDVPLQEISARLDALEKGFLADAPPVWGEINARMTAIENATSALADIARSIIDDVERLQPAKAEEIEFAKPPEPPAAVSTRAGDIEAVASVCLTMNDVLMITRALKDSPDILNTDKLSILGTACRAAGIDPTHGLMIRAGVKYPEA